MLYFAEFSAFFMNSRFFFKLKWSFYPWSWLLETFKILRNQVCWERSVRFADTLITVLLGHFHDAKWLMIPYDTDMTFSKNRRHGHDADKPRTRVSTDLWFSEWFRLGGALDSITRQHLTLIDKIPWYQPDRFVENSSIQNLWRIEMKIHDDFSEKL